MKKISYTIYSFLVFSSLVFSQTIPQKMNYQGVLKDGSGNILPDGSYNLVFRLYNISSGGTALWFESKSVQVSGGVFTTQLGSSTPITLPFTEVYYLGVSVGTGSELIPRFPLSSVGYSFMSLNVPDGSISAIKIPEGQVVKSLNGLNDAVTLVAGSNVTITPNGNNLTISSTGGGGGGISGSGTSNYLPLFTASTTLGNSVIYQTGGNIGIGTITPTAKLDVSGSDALINGLTIGRGTGNISSNSVFGYRALYSNTTGNENTANGMYALYSNTTGSYNNCNGWGVLYSNTTGFNNSAFGWGALYNNTTGNYNTADGRASLYYNTTGFSNTGSGSGALYSNTTGNSNTAVERDALYFNTTGYSNTASGYSSLYSNTTGINNTAAGMQALYSNTTGNYSTAFGHSALYSSTGSSNTAVGSETLSSNTTGFSNTGIGRLTLSNNTSGIRNTAIGAVVLFSNTIGGNNTACGYSALYSNTEGTRNTAFGLNALYSNTIEQFNTGIGVSAGDINASSYCTLLGAYAYPNAKGYTNVMGLGYDVRPTASNQVRIGNSSVSSIGGYAGWTNFSDGRYKLAVNENVKGLDFVMKLRPITYQLDMNRLSADLKENQRRNENGNITIESSETDINSRNEKSQFVFTGFVAQEVEKVAMDLGFDFSGVDKPKNENDFYGLRYAEFVVPLVKAVQEQQKIIEQLTRRIEILEGR